MAKNLVIVESPAKAKTIGGFLGTDYEIKSSYGHVMDLPKKGLGVDIKHKFKPEYEISPDKQKVAAELKKAAKNKTVWLASDEDREGEAIAWHIANILSLDHSKANRIVFHEITKPAITQAIKQPRAIDKKLVDSQQARRILDRLVGYELSPILWKKVRTGLSAGRVQSVAVRLIVEREREIRAHAAESEFKVTAVFEAGKDELAAELDKRLSDVESARKFLHAAKSADFKVKTVEQKPGMRSPGPPFITSTLQQEAARRLGFSVRQTMTLAQRLYEHGHITYMRTDSTNLSVLAINAAETYIKKGFGDKYAYRRQYKTTAAGAQQAHEAIRPTDVRRTSAGADANQKKLYELIWKRAVASQMAPAEIKRTEVKIDISNRKEQFIGVGEILVFDGFFKVYGGSRDDQILPPIKQGDSLKLKSSEALETFSRAPARYSEASLVRKLEELGIGRPSTYAPTISTIQDRGYVEKGDVQGDEKTVKQLTLNRGKVSEEEQAITVGADRNKLLPTSVAEVVTDFLTKHFSSILDYDFTANAEEEFDDIAEGKLGWQEALSRFYEHFHPLIKKSEKVDRADAAQARKLGKDPKTGEIVVVRYGRYGPVLQLGEAGEDAPEDAKPVFAPLPEGTTLDKITLEQALPMFRLPRTVGKTKDGEEITANIGRYGPYVSVGKLFVSIKGQDPIKISEADSRKLIDEKRLAEKRRVVADYGKVKVLRGPYGPYVTNGKQNVKIPPDVEPKSITQDKAQKMLAEALKNPKKNFKKRSRRTSQTG
jgi:DNA topoisomerase I